MANQQTTKPELTNSEVQIIRKALDLFDSESLGFEAAVKRIVEKLTPGKEITTQISRRADEHTKQRAAVPGRMNLNCYIFLQV